MREFVEKSFKCVGTTIVWKGEKGSVNESGVDADNNKSQVMVKVDKRYFCPTEGDLLLGHPTKAKNLLAWSATTSFNNFVK